MAYWLIAILFAYFFFSLSYLGDKLILHKKPEPKSYAFYVGAISIFVVVVIPFIKLEIPRPEVFYWIIAEAMVYIIGLYVMFTALSRFDVSRVMTTIGAIQPLFIFVLTWLLWGVQPLGMIDIAAFVLLLAGSYLISFESKSINNGNYIKITLLSALLFSLDYIFSKKVFGYLPFWEGFIWMRIFVFLFALLFLLSKKTRAEVFKKQNNLLDKKTGIIFLCTHASGGLANILQGFAIALAPIAFLPIVNSLRGIQYVFLFLMTLFLSVFFPKILKEELSKGILIQKIIAIILIVVGLAVLVL